MTTMFNGDNKNEIFQLLMTNNYNLERLETTLDKNMKIINAIEIVESQNETPLSYIIKNINFSIKENRKIIKMMIKKGCTLPNPIEIIYHDLLFTYYVKHHINKIKNDPNFVDILLRSYKLYTPAGDITTDNRALLCCRPVIQYVSI
jgi:predicted transcriptional regulator